MDEKPYFQDLRRPLDQGALYAVWHLDTECLQCEVDDCGETAIVEVEMRGVPDKATCYMHLGFAIEDQWLDASRKKHQNILKSIEKARELIPEHLKNGGDFEYD